MTARPPCQSRSPLPVIFVTAGAAHAQISDVRETRHAQPVGGEVYGDHDLVLDVAPSLRLALLRYQDGWRIN